MPRIFSTQDKEQLKLWDLLQKEDNSPTKQQASEHPDESDSAETVSVSSDSTIDDFITQIDGLNLVSPSIKQEVPFFPVIDFKEGLNQHRISSQLLHCSKYVTRQIRFCLMTTNLSSQSRKSVKRLFQTCIPCRRIAKQLH